MFSEKIRTKCLVLGTTGPMPDRRIWFSGLPHTLDGEQDVSFCDFYRLVFNVAFYYLIPLVKTWVTGKNVSISTPDQPRFFTLFQGKGSTQSHIT